MSLYVGGCLLLVARPLDFYLLVRSDRTLLPRSLLAPSHRAPVSVRAVQSHQAEMCLYSSHHHLLYPSFYLPTPGGAAKADVTPLLRGGDAKNDTNGVKVAGCAMPITLEVSKQQRKADLSLGISVRTGLGDSEEWITGPTTFIPGAQLNLTLPIVPCRETVHALIMRVVNSTESLVLEQVSSNVQGEWQRGLPPPCTSEIKINQFKTLVDFGVGAGL